MASIHIKEIQRLLFDRGMKDAVPYAGDGDGYFLEIRFDDDSGLVEFVDEEYANKVITLNSSYGNVVIVCDENGQLLSIDLS